MKKERLQSSGLNEWNGESACGVWSKGGGWSRSEEAAAKQKGKEKEGNWEITSRSR